MPLWIHIQGWVQLLFSIPERRRCKWVQFTGIAHPPRPLSSTSLPAGTQTVSSRLKYFCRASLRLCPIQLMHHLIQHNNTLGGLLLVGLLMSYRYSLLPPWSTMHPLPFHQIFSMCRLLLMLRKWIQGFWEVKDHQDEKEKPRLIEVVRLANFSADWFCPSLSVANLKD